MQLLPLLAEQAPATSAWITTITSGGAGAALLYLVKKMVDGSIVWRPMAETLERAVVAIEASNDRDDIYREWIRKHIGDDQ